MDTQKIQFIKLPEVRKISGLGTTSIYKLANEGKFPAQVKLGTRSVAWIKMEVEQWVAEKVAAARAQG